MKIMKKVLLLFLLTLTLSAVLGTKLLGQNTGATTSLSALENIYRTAKGTIFGGLPSNKIIIPYLSSDLPASLYPTGTNVSVFYFSPQTGQLQLGTDPTGYTGFIVVDAKQLC